MGKSNITTFTHISACVRYNYRTKPLLNIERATILGMCRSALRFVGFIVRSLLDNIRYFATADQTRFAIDFLLRHLCHLLSFLYLTPCQLRVVFQVIESSTLSLNIGDRLVKHIGTFLISGNRHLFPAESCFTFTADALNLLSNPGCLFNEELLTPKRLNVQPQQGFSVRCPEIQPPAVLG